MLNRLKCSHVPDHHQRPLSIYGGTIAQHLSRMQFTPIQPQEPDQTAVADEAPREAGTALQSQQALIRLQQKMQASSGAVRPNPFLALQSKKVPAQQGEAQQDVVPPSAEGTDPCPSSFTCRPCGQQAFICTLVLLCMHVHLRCVPLLYRGEAASSPGSGNFQRYTPPFLLRMLADAFQSIAPS